MKKDTHHPCLTSPQSIPSPQSLPNTMPPFPTIPSQASAPTPPTHPCLLTHAPTYISSKNKKRVMSPTFHTFVHSNRCKQCHSLPLSRFLTYHHLCSSQKKIATSIPYTSEQLCSMNNKEVQDILKKCGHSENSQFFKTFMAGIILQRNARKISITSKARSREPVSIIKQEKGQPVLFFFSCAISPVVSSPPFFFLEGAGDFPPFFFWDWWVWAVIRDSLCLWLEGVGTRISLGRGGFI